MYTQPDSKVGIFPKKKATGLTHKKLDIVDPQGNFLCVKDVGFGKGKNRFFNQVVYTSYVNMSALLELGGQYLAV